MWRMGRAGCGSGTTGGCAWSTMTSAGKSRKVKSTRRMTCLVSETNAGRAGHVTAPDTARERDSSASTSLALTSSEFELFHLGRLVGSGCPCVSHGLHPPRAKIDLILQHVVHLELGQILRRWRPGLLREVLRNLPQ